MRVKVAEIGWLAGIVDGEGTFGFYECTSVNSKGYKSRTFMSSIRVSNYDSRIVENVARIMSALLNGRSISVSPDRHGFKVSLNKQSDIVLLCRHLIPHLIGKKDQAVLLVNILTNFKTNGRWRPAVGLEIEKLKGMKRFDKSGNTEPSQRAKRVGRCNDYLSTGKSTRHPSRVKR